MRIVFAGTPAFAVPSLRRLAAQHEIVGVLTRDDAPLGRAQARRVAGRYSTSTVPAAYLRAAVSCW